jgi:hypothetical protein
MPIPVPATPSHQESATDTDMPTLAGNTTLADTNADDAAAAQDPQEKA